MEPNTVLPESKSNFFEAPPSPRPSISTSLSGAFNALNVTSGNTEQNILEQCHVKTCFWICESKGADQLGSNCAKGLCLRYVAKSEISSV